MGRKITRNINNKKKVERTYSTKPSTQQSNTTHPTHPTHPTHTTHPTHATNTNKEPIKQPIKVQQSNQPSFLSSLAHGATMGAGMSMGSSIINGLMNNTENNENNIQNENKTLYQHNLITQQPQSTDKCVYEMKQLQSCLNNNQDEISICQHYIDYLVQCKSHLSN